MFFDNHYYLLCGITNMIEWMYSEPPGADPQTISRLTGHIGQTGQGTLEAGQGKST